jgi:hypothetical protein
MFAFELRSRSSRPSLIKLAGFLLSLVACASSAADEGRVDGIERYIADGQYDQAVAASTNSGHYLGDLIARARAKHLDRDPTWVALLHYHKTAWGGMRSQVAEPEFFLSHRGQHDPQAELEATLAGFFSRRQVAPTTLDPQCRFVARFFWLRQQLDFDPQRLPIEDCPKFKGFRDTVNADSLTVIFPSAHPNSPSSMFGHTAVRLDKKSQTSETRMLAYTVNYGAEAHEENNLLYAWKGLTGGFPGRFNVLPYYVKLREYSQMENRDIWEYKLHPTQAQIDLIVMHAYELGPTYFNYYFFTENCAYHVLSLLDVAMPEQKLTSQFPYWTIPIDTLKLLDRRHMIDEVTYQPAHNTIIRKRRSILTAAENDLALRLFEDGLKAHSEELKTLPPERQALVLDLLYDYVRYDRVSNSSAVGVGLSPKEREVLLARSALRIASPPIAVETPATRPDQGHDTARFGLGVGTRLDQTFTDIAWRGAYHDLLDPAAGYSSNSQLEFFNLRLRYYDGAARPELDSLRLIDIVSLEPRDAFFHSVSWHVMTGVLTVPATTSERRDHYFTVNAGGGLTYDAGLGIPTAIYGFADTQVNAGRVFDEVYQAGVGLSAGVLSQLSDRWKLHLSAGYIANVAGDETDMRRLSLEQSLTVGKNGSVRLSLNRIRMLDAYSTEVLAQAYFYY